MSYWFNPNKIAELARIERTQRFMENYLYSFAYNKDISIAENLECAEYAYKRIYEQS